MKKDHCFLLCCGCDQQKRDEEDDTDVRKQTKRYDSDSDKKNENLERIASTRAKPFSASSYGKDTEPVMVRMLHGDNAPDRVAELDLEIEQLKLNNYSLRTWLD